MCSSRIDLHNRDFQHSAISAFYRIGRSIAALVNQCDSNFLGRIDRNCKAKALLVFAGAFGIHNTDQLAIGITMADIKAYQPESKSIGSGQVLQCAYDYDKARLVVREMADQLALDLVDKGLVTDQLVLTVGYDRDNLSDPTKRQAYHGEVTTDR